MKNIHRLLVILALVFAVTACMSASEGSGEFISPTPTISRIPRLTATPTPPILVIGDGGLLSGEPCGPPCFWGMEPGKTTQTEAFDILTSLGLIDTCESIDDYQFAVDEEIGGWVCPSFASIEFRKTTGVISSISFVISPPIQLREVINKYGFPDAVSVVDLDGYHEVPPLSANVHYFDLHAELPIEEIQKAWKYEILPSTLIDFVLYEDESDPNEDFDDALPWHGYGEYGSDQP